MMKQYDRSKSRLQRKKGLRFGKRFTKGQAGRIRRTKGHDTILYKNPNFNVLPYEYTTKLRCRGQGYLTGAGAIPVGFNNSYYWYFNGLTLNNLYAPLGALQTSSIPQVDGLNWSTSPYLQVNGFTSLCNALMYGRAQCLATKVKFRALPSNESDRVNCVIAPLQIGTGGAPPVNITQGLNIPYSKTMMFNVGEKTRPLTMYVDHAKYLGIDPKVYRNQASGLYDQTYNSVPTQQVGLHISMATCDRTSLTNQMGFELEFVYYVRFFEFRTNLQE